MLIVDTDPGTDDAVAIMMLLASETKVDAFVSVYGNVAESITTKNLQRLLNVAGENNAQRFRGCTRPLFGDAITAPHVHGDDGMTGAFARSEADGDWPNLAAVDYIRMIRQADSRVIILALGPLTNIGRAMAGAPDIVDKIDQVIVMGGAVLTWGNTTPAATFNIYNDPTAAAIVYDSGVQVVQVGLDVCRPADIRADKLLDFKNSERRTAQFLWRLFDNHFMVKDKGGLQKDSIIRFNDAPCVAYLLKPELFTSKHLSVRVETEGHYTRGATIADFDGVTRCDPNTEVLLTVNQEGYSNLVTDLLRTYL